MWRLYIPLKLKMLPTRTDFKCKQITCIHWCFMLFVPLKVACLMACGSILKGLHLGLYPSQWVCNTCSLDSFDPAMNGLLVHFLASGLQGFHTLRKSDEVWWAQEVAPDGELAGHYLRLLGKMALHKADTVVHTTQDCAKRSRAVQLVDIALNGTLPAVEW